MTFWTIFAAILSANLLTVAFVWAGVNISRREQRREPLGVYLWGLLLPLLFCGGGLYLAFGGQ